MSKIIKKKQITTLIEATMKQAGLITEDASCGMKDETSYMGEDLGDYYGSFGNSGEWFAPNDSRFDMSDDQDWEEAEYESYQDFVNSPYGRSNPNKMWSIHPEAYGSEKFFNQYKDKYGPLRVRTRNSVMDPVQESVKKLAKNASKKTIISENLKKEIDSFNKLINYKY